jgi:DNA-binding NarL/FixJ family response regulator
MLAALAFRLKLGLFYFLHFKSRYVGSRKQKYLVTSFMIITYLGKHRKIDAMNLTERERIILQLSKEGLSDYKIARKINTDPPSITRSHKNANRKLIEATTDLQWASKVGVKIPMVSTNTIYSRYNYFL